jgi:ectoine hydroxylase-related dioxygenase (phytanoyl-CoA dioxygenase family)
MNFKYTYSDCEKLIKFLNDDLINNKYEDFISIYNNYDFREIINFLVGIKFLEIDEDAALNLFKSNRYFINAVGIKLLPNLQQVNIVKKIKIKNTTIEEIVEDIVFFYKEFIKPNLENGITDQQIKFLDQNGYLIIENVLNKELCDELYNETLHLAINEKNSAAGGYFYGSGSLQRVYKILTKNKIYEQLITKNICHDVMRHIFHRENFHEKYYLTSFHANLLYPKAESQIWHIDSNVPNPIPAWIIRANSNFIIQDYFKDNGATQIIPFSHKFNRKPEVNEINENDYKPITLEASKGSVIFWLGNLWHRSGSNITNKPRIALLGGYCTSYFREMCMEENYYINSENELTVELSKNIKKLIGWSHRVKTTAKK